MASEIEPMTAGEHGSNFAFAEEGIEALQADLKGTLERVVILERRLADPERIATPTRSV